MWKVIGLTAAALTMFGFVPQVLKIYKTKSVKDISLFSLFQFTIGISLWAIYGFHLKNPIIVLANSVSVSTLIIALVLYAKFR